MRTKIRELMVFLLAVCSTVALFADVESTGNLSMALHGDGIAQMIALVILVYVYRRVWLRRDLLPAGKRREQIGYGVISFLFTIAMVIGRGQEANADLKYGVFAVLLFVGYLPLFYVIVFFLGGKITDYVDRPVENGTASGITGWLFEKHVMSGAMLVVILCRLPYLIAFYPCSMSWDGGAQICDFYRLYDVGSFFNHHPPLVSFLYGATALYAQRWGIPNLGMFVIPLIQTCLSALRWRVCACCFGSLGFPTGFGGQVWHIMGCLRCGQFLTSPTSRIRSTGRSHFCTRWSWCGALSDRSSFLQEKSIYCGCSFTGCL